MKGPSGRIRFQIHRGWRCPICGRERLTSGAVVTLRCDRCAAGQPPVDTWMQMVDASRTTPLVASPQPAQPPSQDPLPPTPSSPRRGEDGVGGEPGIIDAVQQGPHSDLV
jgi:hypothetical protein